MFLCMFVEQVSGLGVTDADGKLIDVISVRDLRGLAMESDRYFINY